MAEETVPGTRDSAEAQRLTVTVCNIGDAYVITVSGEIDYQTDAPLREVLLSTAADESPRIVVDLSAVTFMDSIGLNILLTAYRQTTDGGGWLRLAGLSAGLLRVLQIVGVDSILAVYPTVTAALA